MKKFLKDESGVFLIVEAAIIYPIMLIIIMTLLFISIMYTMKANMQTALETSLMYYRAELTDRYVDIGNSDSFRSAGENNSTGFNYTKINTPNINYNNSDNKFKGWSNIYTTTFKEIAAKPDTARFKEIFANNYKFLNFDSVAFNSNGEGNGNILSGKMKISLDSGTNFIIYRDLTATAEYTVKLPFIKGFFGMNNEITLRAQAKIVVSDGVSVMRATDIVDYVVNKSGLDEKIKGLMNSDTVKKIKSLFGM